MTLSSVSFRDNKELKDNRSRYAILKVCVSLLWYVHLCVYRQTRAQKVLGELPGGTSARKLLNRFSTIHLESNSRIIVFARRLFANPKRLLKFPRIRRTKFKKRGDCWKTIIASTLQLVTVNNCELLFAFCASIFHFLLTDRTSSNGYSSRFSCRFIKTASITVRNRIQ